MKLPVPNFAAWDTTKCMAWCTWSARKILTSGWRLGRQRNSNGDFGYSTFARSSGVHPEVHFQPRPQGDWDPVFLPGADGGIRRNVPVTADAHSHDLA